MNSDRQLGAPCSNENCEVKLSPTEPPGRVTRKARRFEAAIAQLRAQGYSLDAIRRALASAGVQVSISTVRREAIRHAAPAVTAAMGLAARRPYRTSPPLTTAHALAPADAAGLVDLTDEAGGKDQAEAFLRSQITNTLLRAKEDP